MSDFDNEDPFAETPQDGAPEVDEAMQALEDFSSIHRYQHISIMADMFPAAPALIAIIWTCLIQGAWPFLVWWFAKFEFNRTIYYNNQFGTNNGWLYHYNWWIIMAGNGAIYGLSFFIFLFHSFGLFPEFAEIWMFWVVQFGGGLVFSTILGFYIALMYQYHNDYKSQLAGTFTKANAADATPSLGQFQKLAIEFMLVLGGQAVAQHYINSNFVAYVINIAHMQASAEVGDPNEFMSEKTDEAEEEEPVEEDIDF